MVWDFQRNEYFWGYADFVDIFGGSPQKWTGLGVISMHFRVFFRGQCTEKGYFLGC